MKIEKEFLILSSGDSILANGGIIGLSQTGEVYTGYDGSAEYIWKDGDLNEITSEQRSEIARYMIAEWGKLL